MLDEELDHIIRDAVDKHHPAYNDKAWARMEKKLDKHLPQKKDRRRFIFFLLFFLLLGGGAFFAITYFAGNENSGSTGMAENKTDKPSANQSFTKTTSPANTNMEDPGNKNTTGQGTRNSGDIITVSKVVIEKDKQLPGQPSTQKITSVNDHTRDPVNKNTTVPVTLDPENNASGKLLKNNSGTGSPEKNKRPSLVSKARSNIKVTAAERSDELLQNKKQKMKNSVPAPGNTVDKMNIVITAAEPESNENITVVTADLKQEENIRAGEPKNDTLKTDGINKEKEVAIRENKTSSTPDKNKTRKNPAGNFGITLSAGPDLSFITLDKPGKITLIYGAGLSYTFKKRITVRAGFYVSNKIYTAEPDQYHTSGGYSYPGLYEVNAVCKVYEIPVSISYHLWQRKKHNWFGNAGLSSFLMKNEKYDYVYKNYGQTYQYKKEIENENKHYFAVLTLSAGYQYRFNRWVSAQAEPYIKLPLAGVGQGKVKLSSSGVLFTITVNPFAKAK